MTAAARHAGQVVTKDELMATVWPDVVVSDESITRCVSDACAQILSRVSKLNPDQSSIIVSVDPSGASGPEDKRSDEIGIVVAAREADDSYYVLADRSLRGSPAQWAARAVAAYREFKADRIVAEANFGGEMVRAVLQAEGPGIPVSVVHHSRGKVARAEPIAALYEKGLVQHVGEGLGGELGRHLGRVIVF